MLYIKLIFFLTNGAVFYITSVHTIYKNIKLILNLNIHVSALQFSILYSFFNATIPPTADRG